eukprot:c8027_g1_i2.p1 GENE.c8027_g1_i2~~c8027_g1_i2.p1  ORF type:complete len:455 (+),score=111.84 c8027_g1_i2:50-1414(+)
MSSTPRATAQELQLQQHLDFLCHRYPSIRRDQLSCELESVGGDLTKASEMLDHALQNPLDSSKIVWWWRFPVSEPTVWKPFGSRDNLLLESSWSRSGSGPRELVYVENDRSCVNLNTMKVSAVYWPEAEIREVCRGTWYFRSTSGTLVPFTQTDSDAIETAFLDRSRWNQPISLPDQTHQVTIKGLIAIEEGRLKGGKGGRQVVRGIPVSDLKDIPLPPSSDSKTPLPEVEHLIFVVHGIGANRDWETQRGARGDSMKILVNIVDGMRVLLNKAAETHFQRPFGAVEVLPINWHKAVHDENDDKINKITVSRGFQPLRQFANDAVVDVLYYMSPNQCQLLMDTVATSMNSMMSQFLALHPNFHGKVSVVGHSLGSIVSFDLLSHQNLSADKGIIGVDFPRLDMKFENLFLLGSPVGLFLSLRPSPNTEVQRLADTKLYNVFHPFDPVVWVTEPA